jgi:hypothetical protein
MGRLQGVQDEDGLLHGGRGPADDPAGEGVHDECDIDGRGPGLHVGEVRHPAPVRSGGDEVAVEQIGSPPGLPAEDRGDDAFAAHRPLDAELAYQTLDGTAGHRMSLPVQLAPDLPGSVDTAVGRVDLLDPLLERLVAHGTGGGRLEAFLVGVVRGRGDLAVVCGERPADRLDPAEAVPVSWADSFVVVPGRCPVSISCCFTQFRSVSREPIPSMSATACRVAVSFGWSSRTSATMRTARRRSSSG